MSVTGTATASQLNSIDGLTSVVVDASDVTAIDGSAEDFATLVAAATAEPATITLKSDFTASVDDDISVTAANALAVLTAGVVTATISNHSASTLVNLETGNAWTVSITGTATADQLNSIDGLTSVVVDASGVTVINGTAEAFASLVAAATAETPTITLAPNFTVTVIGPISVSEANAIDAINGIGSITATISDGAAANLSQLTGTHAYTVTVSDTSVSATDVNTINAATSISVNLVAVTNIGGSSSDVSSVYTAQSNSTVNGLGNETVTLTAGSALITDLTIINLGTNVNVQASAVTEITGSWNSFNTLLIAKANNTITLSNSFDAHLTGTSNTSTLINVDDATSGTLITDALTDTVTNMNTLVNKTNYAEMLSSVTGTITVNGLNIGGAIDMSKFASYHAVTINGKTNPDDIVGSNLSDVLNGAGGNDFIEGGLGADIIDGGAGNDTYIYNSDSDSESSIVTTTTPASGFDFVTITAGDVFDFTSAISAVTSPVNTGLAMGSTGTNVLNQLNTAFQSVDNGNADYEASIINFNGGVTFLVVDSNQDQIINANDQVIQLSGTVTGITISLDGDIVIG